MKIYYLSSSHSSYHGPLVQQKVNPSIFNPDSHGLHVLIPRFLFVILSAAREFLPVLRGLLTQFSPVANVVVIALAVLVGLGVVVALCSHLNPVMPMEYCSLIQLKQSSPHCLRAKLAKNQVHPAQQSSPQQIFSQ